MWLRCHFASHKLYVLGLMIKKNEKQAKTKPHKM